MSPKILSRKERRRLEFGEPTGVGRRQKREHADENLNTKNNEVAKVTSKEMIDRALQNRIGSSGNNRILGSDNDTHDHTDNVNERELFVVPVSGSRGLHLKDIGVVYILTPPKTMDEYLHMAGRTGREGKVGKVVTLASLDELKRLQSWQTALDIHFDVKYTR